MLTRLVSALFLVGYRLDVWLLILRGRGSAAAGVMECFGCGMQLLTSDFVYIIVHYYKLCFVCLYDACIDRTPDRLYLHCILDQCTVLPLVSRNS